MTDILTRVANLGLRTVSYTNLVRKADDPDVRDCWIPRDCVAHDGKAGIFWRMADADRRDVPGCTYSFDGWEPWAGVRYCGTSFGGRYKTFEGALAWLEAVKAREAAS